MILSTSIAYHELTHASQLERMKVEKGYLWASDYWSILAMQEMENNFRKDSPYGSKGGDNWQIIALAEGWANYREWRMSQDYLRYDTKLTSTDGFPYNYAKMFRALNNNGCSYSNMEKAVSSSFSISDFKASMKTMYPALSTFIDKY